MAPVKSSKVFGKAIQTTKDIHLEVRDCGIEDTDRARNLSRWAHQSFYRVRIEAMLKLASEELAVDINDFDTEPDTINCKNGIVNLKTGELVPHSSRLVMKMANVSYKPEAVCPLLIKFLNDIFQKDKELIDWMHRVLGYSLTGSVDEQFILMLYGGGENGKGVLCETILKIMGDYALLTQFDTFLATDKNNVRALAAVGDLKGIRFALALRRIALRSGLKH
jgi:putative DNA primase/helicase